MALTRNKPRVYSTVNRRNSLELAPATAVFEGSAIGIHASTGRVRPLVAGDLFAGFAGSAATSARDVAGAAPTTVRLLSDGEVQLAVPGVTATSIGASVFAADDDTFALTGGSLVGEVLRVPAAGQAVVAFVGGVKRLSSSAVDAGQSLVSPDGNLATAGGRARNRVLKRFLDTVGVTAGTEATKTAATVTLEANSPWGTGVPALKVVFPASNFGWHEVQLTGVANIANFDGHVAWRVWVEDYTATGQFSNYMGTSGYGLLSLQNHVLNTSSTNRFNGEHIVVAGATRAAQSATFVHGTSTLADIKLRITPAAGSSVVWVRDVVIPGVGRPTHAITHDDSSVTWIANGLPYLSAAGLTATFGVYTSQLNTAPTINLTSAQVAQIAEAGHQISCHNVNNYPHDDGLVVDPNKQTATAYAADFVTACNVLAGIVGSALDTTYHPWVQGRNTQSAHDALRARGVRIARGTDPGYDFPQIGLGNNVLSLKTQPLNGMSQAQILAAVEATRKYGLTTTWMVHEITTGTPTGVETAAANYQYLCNLIAQEVQGGQAVHRTMAQLARELYEARLVTQALLAG